MKKTILALCILPLLMSCASQNDKRVELGRKNVEFYSNVWDVAINQGRTDILDTAYVEDAILHTVPEIKGKANAKAYYQNFVTGFSDRKFVVKESFADGDRLVKYWQFQGKHTGSFFGIPATGKTVDIIGCTIVKMRDGKIAEEQDFMDNLEFLRQLGIIPR